MTGSDADYITVTATGLTTFVGGTLAAIHTGGGGGDCTIDFSLGKILGKVFGGNSEQAASSVAQEAGISTGQAGGLMAMLAPMLMGALGKAGGGDLQPTGLSGMLGGLLGGGGGGGGLGAMLGGLLGGGGGSGDAATATPAGGGAAAGMMGKVTGMLDQNKDGSIVDDVQRMAKGGMLQKLMRMFKRR